ncbi:MAG: choice-of-anchor J domain-containing protein [Bacteroidota bacterium]|nr:choice-of-anchor J domain-containing protein [Bacteroidota bacterium]
MASYFNSSAQTIFTEDFNTLDLLGPAPDTWTVHNVDGQAANFSSSNQTEAALANLFDQYTWVNIALQSDPNRFLLSTSWLQNASVQTNRWLVTPAIDLTSYNDGAITLSFKVRSFSPQYLESLKVHISTTGTEVADFTTQIDATNEIGVDWVTKTVDLSAYIGQTIHIGFQHDATDKLYLGLDDVSVVRGNVSVANFEASSIKIYPNPANNFINFTNTEAIDAVKITDINGRVIRIVELGVAQGQIDIADLNTGVYILTATIDGAEYTTKIVKK